MKMTFRFDFASMNYYNEIDPKTCAWIRELIARGLVPNGEIDQRSIRDVQPSDLEGFSQCHFFAGILGWPLALQLAGVSADEPLWTGSCPCQPFSAAGKQLGQSDERHLWPEFFRLIRECRPQRIIGEQVSSAIRHGWLDGISADLEAEGYAVGAVVLAACSVGAPHIRQRLFWVAHAAGGQTDAANTLGLHAESGGGGGMGEPVEPGLEGYAGNGNNGDESRRQHEEPHGPASEAGSANLRLGHAESDEQRRNPISGDDRQREPSGGSGGASRGLGHTDISGSQGQHLSGEYAGKRSAGQAGVGLRYFGGDGVGQPSGGQWDDYDLIHFIDGKTRRIGTRLKWMADGIPAPLVSGRNQSDGEFQKENGVNYETAKADTGEVLQPLQKEDGEEKISKRIGGFDKLQPEEVLRSNLHGELDGRPDQSAIYSEQPASISEGEQECLRGMRTPQVRDKTLRSPQGRESNEQRSLKLEDALRFVPSAYAFAAQEGDTATITALQSVFSTGSLQRILRHTLVARSDAWKSPSCETIQRAWESGLLDSFMIVPLSPLVSKVPARVMRLKGYGNSIAPQLAAEFIRAAMKCE